MCAALDVLEVSGSTSYIGCRMNHLDLELMLLLCLMKNACREAFDKCKQLSVFAAVVFSGVFVLVSSSSCVLVEVGSGVEGSVRKHFGSFLIMHDDVQVSGGGTVGWLHLRLLAVVVAGILCVVAWRC